MKSLLALVTMAGIFLGVEFVSWQTALIGASLLGLVCLYIVCRVERWHAQNYRRIDRRRLDVTCGQYFSATKDFK